jgi:CheY-like chemotaxis protein
MDNNRANLEQEMPRIVIVEDDDAMREFLSHALMR